MMAYRVTTPSGVIADGVWKTRTDIPEIWRDRFDSRFFTEDTDVLAEEMSIETYREIRRQSGQNEDV